MHITLAIMDINGRSKRKQDRTVNLVSSIAVNMRPATAFV